MTILYHRTSVAAAKSIIEIGVRVNSDRILADRCVAFYINPYDQLDTATDALMEFEWTGPEQDIGQLFDPAQMQPNILYNQGRDAKITPVSGPMLVFRGVAIGYPPGDEPQEGREEGQTLLENRD